MSQTELWKTELCASNSALLKNKSLVPKTNRRR